MPTTAVARAPAAFSGVAEVAAAPVETNDAPELVVVAEPVVVLDPEDAEPVVVLDPEDAEPLVVLDFEVAAAPVVALVVDEPVEAVELL